MNLFIELNKQLLQESDVIDLDTIRSRKGKSPAKPKAPAMHYITDKEYIETFNHILKWLTDNTIEAPNRIRVHSLVRNYFRENGYNSYDPASKHYAIRKARDLETPDMAYLPKINPNAFEGVYAQYMRENPEIDPKEAEFQVLLMYLDSNYQMDFDQNAVSQLEPTEPEPAASPVQDSPEPAPEPSNVIPFKRK